MTVRIRAAGALIEFSFDGRPVSALQGETISAALAAQGVVALRCTRGGAPRGLYCGMGVTATGAALLAACGKSDAEKHGYNF